ncbi:ABC transporter ATP-binding protein [Haliovirga abyssi]|uniref:Oligopeptide transport ATP-binding protein OppD n=1 Tax=Haliovirga abyssi TaxID=2996794 RepID=A0AAU9D102_9FUSO|nr:ABC transporter ATP-binding protein [Haliovirga abyssi]BDU49646.1 oligopeptide transport ATP-binding protein OppD [Haliovirga abyssi]
MVKDKILDVKDLYVSFDTYAGEVQAIRGVSFDLKRGESLAIVGESGSGKSVTVQTIMKLIPMPPGRVKSGEIIFEGEDIAKKSEHDMQNIRGGKIGMIFQDPMSSLNPTMSVGAQIAEGIIKHQRLSKKEAKIKALEMLKLVGIPNAEKRIKQYPHEFSGGMRQRVMIGIALSCNPDLLIADEPTTALDVTIQAQILDLMKDLKSKLGTAIILITHDLGVVADIAERVVVMYGGEIMEEADVKTIFYAPKHPYTWGLLQSMPRLDLGKDEEETLRSIEGTPPDLFNPPKGCPFAPRCEYAMKVCLEKKPHFFEIEEGHKAACWLLHEDAPNIESPIESRRKKI